MTTVAQTFEALVAAVRHCPESEFTEIHAVNLVSQLAALPERKACVALVHAKNIPRYFNLFQTIYVLTFYGVRLSTSRHKQAKAYFVFAEIIDEGSDPFAGTAVRVLEPDDPLMGAVELKVAA